MGGQMRINLRSVTDFKQSDLYRARIHQLIPGGCHTYSKGDDQFPLLSPAAISRGLGCKVWDLDGNEYLDCSMGLTSVSLGHAYPPVIEKVRQALELGVNFQRPASIELEMAESFLSRLPGHEMIKFAKNGSTATTAAIKIARAVTGRNVVAFPGNHPFYSYDDWFISKTPCNLGIPRVTESLSATFEGCSISSLEKLFSESGEDIACVITEPARPTCGPTCACGGKPEEFIRKAIALCESKGALLVLDEMITGYKAGFPGFMSRYGLIPHLATWGKSIGNGFSFCAITGKREFMEIGGINRPGKEKLFLISSTHGGEVHSIAAALETARRYQSDGVLEHLHSLSSSYTQRFRSAVREEGLANWIEVYPCEWVPATTFKRMDGSECSAMRTLFMQEMIARGVLFQGVFSPCFSHQEADLDYFETAAREALRVYKAALTDGPQGFLIGEPSKPVFRKFL